MAFLTRRPALLSLFLGAVAACGFAPLDLWPLTLGCFAVWLLLVHRAASFKQALWLGWCFGVGHFTVNDNWFQHAFDFQDKMPPVLGYAAPLALALYLAVWPAAAAGLAWRYGRRERADAGYVLVFAAAWIVTEWLRATTFTGYAWDPLGVIWVPVQAVAALSAWIGTYALSGLTVALAGAVLLAVRRRAGITAVAGALAVLLVAQGLSYRGTPPAPGPNAVRLVVVQPNVSQDQRGQSDAELLLTRLSSLSGRPGGTRRLVLWPEGVIRDLIEDGYPWWVYERSPTLIRWRMARLLAPGDTLLTGGQSVNWRGQQMVSATNAVYAIDHRARITGRYDKAHLVPWGEYLPVPWLTRPLGLSRLVPGDLDFIPGPGPRAIDVPGVGAVGIQLCYEIVFSGEVVDLARRPRFIFNPSNDAWFGKWGPPQHLAQARMRAIEEGLPIVRATPTGISAIIGADGRMLSKVPHMEAGAIEAPLPPALPPTLFSRVGNWAAAAVTLLLLAAAIALRRPRR